MGIVLYLFRKNRRWQVAAFVAVELLYDLVYVGVMVSAMPDFHWTQMFTMYYEWYGALAAVPMVSGAVGTKRSSMCFTPPTFIFSMPSPGGSIF